MPELPYWFIGMAVVFVAVFGGGLVAVVKVGVDVAKLRRNPPIETYITEVIDAAFDRFTERIDSQIRDARAETARVEQRLMSEVSVLHKKLSGTREELNGSIDKLRADVASARQSAADHSEKVMERIGELRGELRRIVGSV